MTIDKLPKLLKDSIEQNDYDIDVITKHLKLPWLKLDLDLGSWTQDDCKELHSSNDWRTQWEFPDAGTNAYQVKGWNGKVLFGPTDFRRFLDLSNNKQHDHDEDSKCRFFRQQLDYGWITENHISKKINKIIPDEDLNLVNSYVLPAGGYIFPHRDYAIDGMGLAKLYIAVRWSEGNLFGMYGCGNINIQQGDVFLINNYTLPHWVYNGSKDDRIVLDISANLHSPLIKQSIISSFKKIL